MIQFIKTRDVKSPLRNAEENAGIDFYIPENNDDFIHDLTSMYVDNFDLFSCNDDP